MALFDYYIRHSEKLPALYRNRIGTDPVERCVCDFLAGMTDRYAIEVYSELFIPKVWKGPVV